MCRARAGVVASPMRPCRLRGAVHLCRDGRAATRAAGRGQLRPTRALRGSGGPPARDHDESSQALAVWAVAGCAHHSDDLLNLRRIGLVAKALVAWRAPRMEPRHRRRRTTPTARSSNTSDMTPPRTRGYEPGPALPHQSASARISPARFWSCLQAALSQPLGGCVLSCARESVWVEPSARELQADRPAAGGQVLAAHPQRRSHALAPRGESSTDGGEP